MDEGGPRDAAWGTLRACSSECTFPLFTGEGLDDSERASLIRVWVSSERMPLDRRIRLDVIFVNAGVGDKSGDKGAAGESNGDDVVEGSVGGWTETVKSTGSACGLLAYILLDKKGRG